MTSSGTPAHEDLLAEALYALDRSKDRDGVLTSAIAAAERMNGCVGAVLLSVQRPDSQFYAPGDASPRAVTWHPAPPSTVELELGHTIAIDSSADVRVIGESFERSVQTTLVAALNGASGWDAIGFIWGRPIAFDAATVAFYRSLASAISLALQVRLTAQEASRGQDGFRRNIDELQHRLRSVLSFVRSIVRRTLLSAESPEEFAVHLEARISAVSRIYATLSIGAKGGGTLAN